MKYLIKFSGEHSRLHIAETRALVGAEGFDLKIAQLQNLWHIVETDAVDFVGRSAYISGAFEFIGSHMNYRNLVGDIFDSIQEHGSFRIDSGSQTVSVKLGKMLVDLGLRVSLKEPEVVVGCYALAGKHYAGIRIPLNREFSLRKPQHRPYFHPTSMHPKLARCLVNLSGVVPGETLLDPFCGTGGILIEAGLMDVGVAGWDVNPQSVDGCRRNLGHYGLSGKISEADALNKEGSFEAIVTDPPYGRASITTRETQSLFDRFIQRAYSILKQECRLVLMGPDFIALNTGEFRVKDDFSVRMHKSLTRKIWVMEKS